jgi:hypothetical protein
VLFGVSAALTKATVDQVDEGVIHLLIWHLRALRVVGYASMTLSEISLQTGVLAPAIATASIFDPIARLILGTTLLEESLQEDAVGIAASALALAAMFAALIVLAHAEGAREDPSASVPEP